MTSIGCWHQDTGRAVQGRWRGIRDDVRGRMRGVGFGRCAGCRIGRYHGKHGHTGDNQDQGGGFAGRKTHGRIADIPPIVFVLLLVVLTIHEMGRSKDQDGLQPLEDAGRDGSSSVILQSIKKGGGMKPIHDRKDDEPYNTPRVPWGHVIYVMT